AAYAAQREIEEGRRIVVGVNAFREAEDAAPPVLVADPEIERDQIERLKAFRASRDARAAAQALEALARDAREDRNLMPGILAAVTARACLGEVVSALQSVFGEHGAGG